MLKTAETKTRYESGDIVIVVIEKTDNAESSRPIIVKEVQIYSKNHGDGDKHNSWRANPTGITELVKALITLGETHSDLFSEPLIAHPQSKFT